jgi:hypothetical protein
MAKEPALSKLYIHIIESPSPLDILKDNREGAVLTEGLKLLGIENRYYMAINKSTFSNAIDQTMDNYKEGLFPAILHLSSHGNQDGVQLSDGVVIPWEELRTFLIPINKLVSGSLMFCISSCEGFQGLKMAQILVGDLPYKGIIGPDAIITWKESALGFLTYYHHIFTKQASVPDAVQAMRVASGNSCFNVILASKAKDLWVSQFWAIVQALQAGQPPTK